MDRAEKAKENLLGLMLKPALRFCLRNAINFPAVVEALKIVLIDLAVSELDDSGDKVTVSRIAVMTGMNRRDVTRIYKEGRIIDSSPKLVHRVINRWEQSPSFVTKSRKPRVLSYEGENSDFKLLCQMVSKDINPATMLYELERQGAVERSARGIRLVERVEFVNKDPSQGLELLAQDSETLVRAVEENLFEPQDPRNLHLRTEYDNIFQDAIPGIRQWVYERGQAFHREVRHYLSLHDKDISPQDKVGGARVVLTAFSWTEDSAEAEKSPKVHSVKE